MSRLDQSLEEFRVTHRFADKIRICAEQCIDCVCDDDGDHGEGNGNGYRRPAKSDLGFDPRFGGIGQWFFGVPSYLSVWDSVTHLELFSSVEAAISQEQGRRRDSP
jgi:hypothetical protein